MAIIGTATKMTRIGTGDTVSGVFTYTGIEGIIVEDVALTGATTTFAVAFDKTKVQMISIASDVDVNFSLVGSNITWWGQSSSFGFVAAGDLWLWTIDNEPALTGDVTAITVTNGTGVDANISIKVVVGA